MKKQFIDGMPGSGMCQGVRRMFEQTSWFAKALIRRNLVGLLLLKKASRSNAARNLGARPLRSKDTARESLGCFHCEWLMIMWCAAESGWGTPAVHCGKSIAYIVTRQRIEWRGVLA